MPQLKPVTLGSVLPNKRSLSTTAREQPPHHHCKWRKPPQHEDPAQPTRNTEVAQMVDSACNAGDPGSHTGFGKIPWRKKWQPTPVFFSGESHGQRTLAGHSSWTHRVRPTERRTLDFFFFLINFGDSSASSLNKLKLSEIG